ncbi:hypothetical protein ABY44_14040, partial [Burkholderia sp. ZZQ-2]|uniref:hypothetical protein n=1 Tax=Burkholderia sp. ZZQ-2 TaxID=1661766 RepID=UPI003D6DF01F
MGRASRYDGGMRGLAGVVRSDDVKAAIVLALRSTQTIRCLCHHAVPPLPLPIPPIRSTRRTLRRPCTT